MWGDGLYPVLEPEPKAFPLSSSPSPGFIFQAELPRLVLYCDPPVSASQVAGIASEQQFDGTSEG